MRRCSPMRLAVTATTLISTPTPVSYTHLPLFIEEIANIPDWVITDSVNEQYQTYKGLMSQEFQNFISNSSQTAETTAENMQKSIEQALGLG